MRFQFSNVLLRTLYTLSTLTRTRASQQQNPLLRASPQRVTALRSMPIPLLGSLFSSKAAADADASSTMSSSYPDNRSDNEWRAVLNKGKRTHFTNLLQLTHLPLAPCSSFYPASP